MSDPIRVNGNLHGWGSIVCKIDDERVTGFTGITYADKRESVMGYGMARHHAPYGRTPGKYSVEPSKLTGYVKAIKILRARLAVRATDGKSYGNVVFQIVIEIVEPDDDGLTIELDRCTWSGSSADFSESPDPLKEEIEVQPMLIRRNGLVLFDATEGAP